MHYRTLMLCLALLLLSTWSLGQTQPITGSVKDAAGLPLPGITVTEKGSSNVTVTNDEGKFSISSAANAILEFTGIGFTSQSLKASPDMVVVLEANSQQLEEVAIVGYSSKKKSELSSAVTTVSAAKLNDVTSANVGALLQGKVPGVVASVGSGDPTSGASLVIRGQGSINTSSAPLVVVDGNIGGTYNPTDVESITVLRDAAATGLYGSRAANGVMIITTKTGKAGKTRVEANAIAGMAQATTGNFKLMNAQQLYDYQSTFFTPDPAVLNNDTDWWDMAFRTAQVRSYTVSASGGTEKTQYYVSGNYYQEEGTLINNNNNRYNFRANLSSKLTKKLKLTTNLTGLFIKDEYNPASTVYDAYLNLPYDPAYNADGIPVDSRYGTWWGRDRDNFLHNLQYDYSRARSYNTTADVNLEYNIMRNLTFSSYNRANIYHSRSNSYYDKRSKSGTANNGEAYVSHYFSNTLLSSNRLRYSINTGDHSISVLAVAEAEQTNIDQNGLSIKNLPAGRDAVSTGTEVLNLPSGGYDKFMSMKYLGQLDYSFANRYFFTGSYVNEYSSKFSSNNPTANFYQLGASWIISNESFMPAGAVSFLKLRGSFGTTGNSNWDGQYGYYVALGLYDLSSNSSYAGLPGAAPSQKANPDLTWEKIRTANLGVDLTLWKRIDLAVDVYDKKTTSLLFRRELSALTGYTHVFENVGALRNRGLEINLTTQNIKNKNFAWETNFNISFNRNKILSLDEGRTEVNSGFRQPVGVGRDMKDWFMPEWAGVNPDNGDPLWVNIIKDVDGVEYITYTNNYNLATRKYTGKSGSPKFTGGFTNTFAYKGFTLNAFFNFVYGNYVYNDSRFYFDNDGLYESYNQMQLAKGWSRWEKPGDIATHPKTVFGRSDASNATSTRYLEDGSYLRLRNITLGYNLPAAVISKLKVSGIRVFVSGDNLWTGTKFSGTDPEVDLTNGQSSIRYPISRKLLGGINVSF